MTLQTLTQVVPAVLGFFLVFQLIPVLRYARMFKHAVQPPLPEPPPKFCVVTPMRGADPSIREAVAAVLRQDYPNFEWRIVIDSREDPAWVPVTDAVRESGADNVHVEPLAAHPEHCSLICSSIIQGVTSASDDCQLITFSAGDSVAYPSWLRDMASAMQDPAVGSTLGNRWYMPPQGRWGSLVRYLWNVGAVVPMWVFQIPWSGTMALRREDLEEAGLIDIWRRSLVEDATLKAALESTGRKLKFVPGLIIVNREEIDLRGCFRFIQRQLLWTRLYHPHWWAVVANALLFSALLFAPLVLAGVTAARGYWELCAINLAAFAVYVLAQLGLTATLERAVRRGVTARGEEVTRYTAARWLRLAVAIPLAQLVYLVALLGCFIIRRVRWRGIWYRLEGRGRARMERYEPFTAAPPDTTTGSRSL